MTISSWIRSLRSVSGRSRAERKHGPLSRKRRACSYLWLETLEDRTLLSTINWIGGSGNWHDPTQWDAGRVPGSGDDAVINLSPALTVTIQSSDSIQVQS